MKMALDGYSFPDNTDDSNKVATGNTNGRGKEKCWTLTCNLKADYISLVYHMNETKKVKEKQNTKTDELITSGNGPKTMRSVEKEREKDLWKRFVWVWSGKEKEWCKVKVMMMMMMMTHLEKLDYSPTSNHWAMVAHALKHLRWIWLWILLFFAGIVGFVKLTNSSYLREFHCFPAIAWILHFRPNNHRQSSKIHHAIHYSLNYYNIQL